MRVHQPKQKFLKGMIETGRPIAGEYEFLKEDPADDLFIRRKGITTQPTGRRGRSKAPKDSKRLRFLRKRARSYWSAITWEKSTPPRLSKTRRARKRSVLRSPSCMHDAKGRTERLIKQLGGRAGMRRERAELLHLNKLHPYWVQLHFTQFRK